MSFRKYLFPLLIFFQFSISSGARADLFGGDIAVLFQILQNNISQLYQLYQVVRTGQDTLNMMREINRGINDSLNLAQAANISLDPGLYSQIRSVQEGIQHFEQIYGQVENTREAAKQRNVDRIAAEAINLHNVTFSYASQEEQVGKSIDRQSHAVSPGGAQKLSAQGIGHVLQTLGQSLRAESTSVKLQAEALAIENKKDKDLTHHMMENSETLKHSMQQSRFTLDRPRF